MTPAADAPTRPALRYRGAKWVLSSWIVSCLPADHDSYIEPFGGSAAVLLNKPRSNLEIYNDLDGDVVNTVARPRTVFLSESDKRETSARQPALVSRFITTLLDISARMFYNKANGRGNR
ncbi:protein of unknown function (plasmid) [Candidatus Promineifilum breve]|uniref:DNA adenine methylase n=1 Tax=Candidatus Promineifilum breve TaxID=1806508 RepID=A0A160T7J8_9CHLR|nr:protein of unknown function [Candidatus Promineifilum breve]